MPYLRSGEFHLGYDKASLQGTSWYNLIHSENLREAQSKHRLSKSLEYTIYKLEVYLRLPCHCFPSPLVTQSEQDRSCILLVRMQRSNGDYTWVHVVLQVRDSPDSTQQPVIVCTNQVLK